MSDNANARAETQSPQARLIQMATAHWISRFLYVAALINLADHVAERPKTAEELAPLTAAAVQSLYRDYSYQRRTIRFFYFPSSLSSLGRIPSLLKVFL